MKAKRIPAPLCSVFLTASLLFSACKKESSPLLFATFSNTTPGGMANENGDYTMTGHISSKTPLDKITLTKQGQASPFFTDESTAKNKKEYDYSCQVTGITTSTSIIMDVYDQDRGRSSVYFVIKK